MKRLSFLIWLLVTLLGAQAQQFLEVTAEIELLRYRFEGKPGGEPTKFRTYFAKCIFGTNEWRIDNDFVVTCYEAWYSEGTNVFHRLQFGDSWKPPTNSRLAAPTNIDAIRSNITVYVSFSPGGHPLGNLGVNVPWLAFCSGPYLRRPARDIPLPTTEIRIEPYAFSYSDQTEVFDDELGLPKTVELRTSKARYETSRGDDRLLRYTGIEAARTGKAFELPENALAYRYSVNAVTNCLGWTLPLEFSYTTYRFGSERESIPFLGGVGRLKAVRKATKPENVFLSDRGQTIVDYRFRHKTRLVDGIVYSRTNLTAPPATNDPALRSMFERAVKGAVVGSPTPTLAKKQTMRIILVVLIVLPPLVVFGKIIRKTKTKG
jgi:hypothetical protein